MRRKQLAIIVDVDGTLCDVRGIRHYILSDPQRRDFRAFHAASALCPPHLHVLEMVREYADAGIVVHVVTARMNEWRFVTGMWLRKWEVPFDRLWMRRDGDGRPDREVKLEILRRIQEDHEVIVAMDDNPAVLELWQEERIPTITVPGWYEVVS